MIQNLDQRRVTPLPRVPKHAMSACRALSSALSIGDLRRLARRKLPRSVLESIDGSATRAGERLLTPTTQAGTRYA